MKKIFGMLLLAVITFSICGCMKKQEQRTDAEATKSEATEQEELAEEADYMYIDLTMNDINGKSRKLSDYCGKGNYVLIDFWASWCGPCIGEMPNIIENYNKYHSKGFDIVGISFDKNKEAWVSAVAELGLEWHQLSDLAGWSSIGASTYGITSIPANILVDGEGRIVAGNLRGAALGEKLQEIYGQ